MASWLLIEGKQHYRTRLISVYRPCHSETNLSGVYLQHRRYFGLQGQDREPREALLEDLYCQIEQWKTDGDQIVVGGDFNEDVRSSSVRKYKMPAGPCSVPAPFGAQFELTVCCKPIRL